MRCINAKPRHLQVLRGFTLVELLVATAVSLVVFAALFSAYIYIARNLTRITFVQQQSMQSSRLLRLFANDIGSAVRAITASNQQLILQMPPPAGNQVTYTYTYVSPDHGTLQRTDTTGSSVILDGITPLPFQASAPFASNIFNYYSIAGTPLLTAPTTSPPTATSVLNPAEIKQIELSYMCVDGVANNGTEARNTVVSSRMVLRNKPPLGQ
jgi:prepilin-type N-terminal cleavage/methylation domain-containing protein